MSKRVPEAQTNRSWPWRYCCPDCESQQVKQLIDPGTRIGDLPFHGGAVKIARNRREHRFRCDSCQERKRRVYDRKEQRETTTMQS